MHRYIITLAELKKYGLTNENTDERLLSASLQRAQQIDLVNATCKAFVDDYLAKNGVYNATEKALLDDFVVPYLAICLDIRAVEATSNRIDNAGHGRVNSSDFQRATDEDRRLFINSLRHDKMTLENRLRKATETHCGGGASCGAGGKSAYPNIMTL